MNFPTFFEFDNNFNNNSINNIEYRYWLCVQISLAYVSVSEVCMRYNMEENLMNDWVLNYMYYDVEEDDCVIDNLGRSLLIQQFSELTELNDDMYQSTVVYLINKQLQYTQDRILLRTLLANRQ